MDNFQIQYPHSFPIVSGTISDNSFNIIKEKVKTWLKINYDKLSPAWNCPTLTSINLPEKENISIPELKNEIKNITQLYTSNFLIPTNLLHINMWINVSPFGAYQEYHHHLSKHNKAILSGAIYINAPSNSGDFFIKNHLDKEYMLLGLKGMEEFHIKASNKTIITFPSWMEHRVGTNNTNENRISISWNIFNDIK